jgi:hypothetical protein
VWFISELSEIRPWAEEKDFEYFHTY